MCLKHFRQKNMMDVYETLKAKTGIEIEHPMVGELHKSLVINGDFDQAEKIILDAEKKQFFHSFVKDSSYKPDWKKLNASNDGKRVKFCILGGNIQFSVLFFFRWRCSMCKRWTSVMYRS